MVYDTSEEEIRRRLAGIKHPEINCTLVDLGMLRDISIDSNKVTLTLKLPIIGIPTQVKDMLANSINQALVDLDTRLEAIITVAQMSQEERMKFFSMARANWTG
jgi:metal-sulfur cluster biosynthetic enzyme